MMALMSGYIFTQVFGEELLLKSTNTTDCDYDAEAHTMVITFQD